MVPKSDQLHLLAEVEQIDSQVLTYADNISVAGWVFGFRVGATIESFCRSCRRGKTEYGEQEKSNETNEGIDRVGRLLFG